MSEHRRRHHRHRSRRDAAPIQVPWGILGAVVLAIAVLAIAGWLWSRRTHTIALDVNRERNVLLVTIDTLRADALGAYGGRATTPNLDRLAAQGVRFDFAHAHAVVTLASHASILSGRYPYEHGIRDNTGYRFPKDQPTAATLLKAQGFATGAFIGGFPLDHRFGLAIGFDVYDDHLESAPDGEAEAADRERRADVVVRSALEWIGKQPGKWFTWVHVYDPHAPYQPPYEWAAKFPSDPYLGEVSWTDAALAPLFDHLSQEQRPTLVIVTGDHGEGLGDHGELTHSLFAYESTLHVPLIVTEVNPKAPARTDGAVISTPVRHIDLVPTMLDAVGAPAATGLQGASLRPLMATGSGPDRPSYFEAMSAAVTRGWAPLRGVIVGREKYVDLPITELYDLKGDPRENENLAPAHPDRTQVLYNTLKLFSIAPPAQARKETPETLERLRSLGYIGGGTATVKEKYTEHDDPKRLVEIEQQMTQAADAVREGRTGEAIELYRRVIIKRADTEDAYRRLALVYWRTGQQNAAIATLESALRAGVTQPEVRFKLGQYLAVSGQPEKAIALLEHDAGDDPDALIALGNAYSLAGRNADAVRTFTHLLALDPKSALAYQNLGSAELSAGNVAGAEAALRKAVELNPTLAGAYTALGVVLARSGRRADAIDMWKHALDLDAADFNAMYNVTINLAQAGREKEALTFGERFIATAPSQMKSDVEQIKRVLKK